jgi:triosephosphate isomerase (TIM)
MRKHIVAGNWKLNKNIQESQALAGELKAISAEIAGKNVQVVVCPSTINVYAVAETLKGSGVAVGVQNCYTKESGAFTGETSVSMAKAAGADYVILGHSERREYFGESDSFLAEKVKTVLAAGLTPIFCCGETLPQRESGIHFDFVKGQLTAGLFDLSEADFRKVVIAYEPIWAIGTGVTASSAQAQEMHKVLRDHVGAKYGASVADDCSLLYGGSCKGSNAKELFACPDVDGGLIGGASLVAREFIDIALSF